MTRLSKDPRLGQLRDLHGQLGEMLATPVLYCGEEALGKALAVTSLAFDIAGCGQEETQRTALAEAIRDYVDLPALDSERRAA